MPQIVTFLNYHRPGASHCPVFVCCFQSFVERPCEVWNFLRLLRPLSCTYIMSLISHLPSIKKEQVTGISYIIVCNWGIRKLCPLYINSYVHTDFIINCKLRQIFSVEVETFLLKCDRGIIPYVLKKIDKGQESQYLFWILISIM